MKNEKETMESVIALARKSLDKTRRDSEACAERVRKKAPPITAKPQSNTIHETLPSEKTQYLFRQFSMIFSSLWAKQRFSDTTKRNLYVAKWNEILHSIPQPTLECVCNKMALMSREEMPGIPRFGDFVKLCKNVTPEELGFPSLESAYTEGYLFIKHANQYAHQRWSHPVVCEAAHQLFAEGRKQQTRFNSEFSLFKDIYLQTIQDFLSGKPMQARQPQSYLPQKPSVDTALAEQYIKKLRAQIK